MDNRTVYKRSDDFVFRKIANETILVPIKKTIQKLHSIYTLNPSACCVWGLLDGKRTVADIVESMKKEFAVRPETIAQDLGPFLDQLASIGAIQRS